MLFWIFFMSRTEIQFKTNSLVIKQTKPVNQRGKNGITMVPISLDECDTFTAISVTTKPLVKEL